MNGPKTYVLYHGNCYDGFGAALAAWMHFNGKGINAEYIPVIYGKDPPQMEQLSDVFIIDFSYPPAELLKLAQDKNTVVVLDHHKTAEKDLSMESWLDALGNPATTECTKDPTGWIRVKNIHLKFDMTKSGAVMAWEHFHPNFQVPLFFQYLQDRDLWSFKLPHSRAISCYMRTLPWDFGVWHHVMDDMESERGKREIVGASVACLKLTDQMVDTMAQNARMMVFNMEDPPHVEPHKEGSKLDPEEYLVPVANATIFFSEVGQRLLELHPEAPFSAYYLDRADGMRQWGLRSREDFDSSAIAKAFGGGGHKQSSGFVQKI